MKSESCKRTSNAAATKSCGHKKEMTKVEMDWEQKAGRRRALTLRYAALRVAQEKMKLREQAIEVMKAEVAVELEKL